MNPTQLAEGSTVKVVSAFTTGAKAISAQAAMHAISDLVDFILFDFFALGNHCGNALHRSSGTLINLPSSFDLNS
jgi:hypothetical protein